MERVVHFNPRSPCGERRTLCPNQAERAKISIHAPRVGSDRKNHPDLWALLISIHAPRVGSDLLFLYQSLTTLHFNPRSPCGERHRRKCYTGTMVCHFNPRSPCGERHCYFLLNTLEPELFQSTLPVWGATTAAKIQAIKKEIISIHAPRVGSDSVATSSDNASVILIHAPRVGSDVVSSQYRNT